MSSHREPKKLAEFAFTTFTSHMENEARQMIELVHPPSTDSLWIIVELGIRNCLPSKEIVTEVSRKCTELKNFYHGMKLGETLANKLTGHFLIQLDSMCWYPSYFPHTLGYRKYDGNTIQDYFESKTLILDPITEVFLHPEVTDITLDSHYAMGSSLDHILYCDFVVPKILTMANKLNKLKALNLRLKCYFHVGTDKLALPSQLEQLTLYVDPSIAGERLRRIVESCPHLKCLKLTVTSEEGINHILKCKQLEALHVMGNPMVHVEEDCVEFINRIATDKSSDVLSTETLRSFGLTLKEESTLRLLVKKLPMLTEIRLCLMHDFNLFSLTELKNLRSLKLEMLDRNSDEYKKILPVLGKNLVTLELKHYYTLDIELIGQTCFNLTYLSVSAEKDINAKPSLKMYPNLRTVQQLKVNMPLDYHWTHFVIAQCVNIKVLAVTLRGSLRSVMEKVLGRTSAARLKEIRWSSREKTDKNFLRSLHSNNPTLDIEHELDFQVERFNLDYYEVNRFVMYFKD